MAEAWASAVEVCGLVRAAGGRAYVVGGAVRDLLSHIAVKDVDVEVFGIGIEELSRALAGHFEYDACGKSFGVLKLQHTEVDVALARRESKQGQGHRGFMVQMDPAMTLTEAASRRDFTINAIYYDPLNDVYEDPFGGMADLRRRMLRHVSDKFKEDPLRVLRGMQFVARFDLFADPTTIAVCRTMGMEGLARERVLEEWRKFLLRGVNMRQGMLFLRATGWVRHFPELRRMIGCKQEPEWHPEGDVWNHTGHCLNYFAANRIGDATEDFIVGLGVLCHDLGKPSTTHYERGRLRSIGHDVAGVEVARKFLARLTNDAMILDAIPPLVQHHMAPFVYWKNHASAAAIRRLSTKVKRLDRLLRVAEADDAGRPPFPRDSTAVEWMRAQAQQLDVLAAAPKPIVMGRHLIAQGLKPSPQFHHLLEFCYNAQVEGRFSDLEGGLEYLKSLMNSRKDLWQ